MQISTLPESPSELRSLIRRDELVKTTSGMAPGRVQTNLAVLPKSLAFDFLLFCQRNPKPCPLLEVLEPGNVSPEQMALGADLRTDIPKYRVYQDGVIIAEVGDVTEFWRDDLVSFLLGCSFSFETAMVRAGMPLRHIEQDTTVPMYVTNIETNPAGVFSGPTVVSMRPIPRPKIMRAVQVTSRFPATHGSPLHIGNPEVIGITDISKPDFGEPTEIRDGEVPVFWACGVTPQAVAMKSKPPFMITHAPGYMFITDKMDEDLAIF